MADFAPVNAGQLSFDDRTIEYATWGADGALPALVLLHEGLGSVGLWRDFPERLAVATGTRVVAYSRFGYGRSSTASRPRPVHYLHDEARTWLPRVLDALGIDRCVLFGHSDGASIAMIHSADRPSRVGGIVLLAPHVLVEDVTLRGLAATRDAYLEGGLRARLAKWHDDVDAAFHGWNDLWLDPAFRDWNIEALVERIEVPTVAIQGRDDEYGTLDQLERIRRRAAHAELVVLDACGHAPQRDRPDDVIRATNRCLAAARARFAS